MIRYLIIALSLLALASCGEYNKVLKSNDYEYKYQYAKKAFEKKKYVQASTILSDLVTVFKGTPKAEESLYLLGLSHYENHDYTNSGTYFKTYYTHYPKGQYTELARFYAGYGYYLDSPEAQLDQSMTIKAIEELQNFLDYFPKSDKVTIAQNAIKDYPYSKYKEPLELLVLKSKYQEAAQSIEEKKADRFREVVDEYYSFINDYPESENRKEADNIFKIAQRYVKE